MALQKTPLTSSPAHVAPPVAPKAPVAKKPATPKPPGVTSAPFWTGLGVSLAWIAAVLVVIAKAGPAHSLAGVSLADWAVGISAIISPVAMVWMVTAYLQRAADIQTIADPLRRQLTLITGESGAADARIRRFNQALREQIDLLRSAQTVSQDDLEGIMDRMRQHRVELERFENSSTQQVKEIQDVVRRSMFQMEQMMDDKFTMLRVLDGKLQKNGDGVAHQVESVGEQVAKMLEEIEGASVRVADALDRAQRDSQRLADTSRLQESSLTHAAEAASETLGGLSSKIDLSVARFLERASSTREEAERLAHALDAQTRALDDFSTTLPLRVGEAESVLRGVADRLYASEQMAREQAVNLSEKLSMQVDGLQSFMDRFTVRLSEIDTGLGSRQTDLNGLAERIGSVTSGFLNTWEKSVTDLSNRTGNSLLRFTVVNDETRRNADQVASHLDETTAKYEDVVLRMRALSSDSGVQMKELTEEIARHLVQFEALSSASNKAGEEVQARAGAAMQNLQHVLERVIAAREATQSVGETLVRDIGDAVTQNEKMIERLTEAAQLGARTIGLSTENLGRQQGELANKARASEAVLLDSVQKLQQQADVAGKSLREQTAGLMNLLSETQGQLVATDQKMQGFAAQAVAPVQKAMQQIDASADQGLKTLSAFGDGISAQVNRLQDFHARVGGMSQEMSRATAESASALESIGERFAAMRADQEGAARQTLAQFSELSDRLQREVGSLDSQAAHAAELLQQAALKVGEQSYQMMEKAQNSGAQIKDVAGFLQAEAERVQTILRQQSEEIGSDLARAEQKFATLGESVRQRADTAYALLDRVAAHYGDVSQKLDQTVGAAQSKVETLNVALALQADKIGDDAVRIEKHAGEISSGSNLALQSLASLSDKMAATHDSASALSQQTLGKLDETTASFQRRTTALSEAAQVATEAVVKAGGVFGEQTGKLVSGAEQIDGVLRQLTNATGALTDQASAIRLSMEQQNSRLLAQLADSVSQLDITGTKLQHVALLATQGADKAQSRFADMTESSSRQITATAQDLHAMADRAEEALSALGADVTRQAASLAVVGDQIGAQQKVLAEANEKQRAQMLDMFDKLGAAHAQASQIAEKSISYLSASLEEISKQIAAVEGGAQSAVGTVKVSCAGFSDQSVMLLQNAQAAEAQARTVLQVTSALQDQARQLRESLTAESERAGESLGALLSRLTSGGAQVRELGVSTGDTFAVLQKALSAQTSELGLSMEKIGERQKTLTATLDQQREAIGGLLNRLTSAQDETAAAAERAASRLEEGAQQITRSAEEIDTRAQNALSSVKTASAGFAYEVESIEKQAKQAEEQSRAIAASASEMHDKISGLRFSMREEGDLTVAVFDSLLEKVTGGAKDIRDLSVTTELSLTGLGNNVATQSAALTSTMEQISSRQQTLAASLDGQREVIGGLLNRLTSAQDETAAAADRAASRLEEGTQKITHSVDGLDSRVQSALSSVKTASAGFAYEVEAIEKQAKQAETQSHAIATSASEMHDKISGLRSSMREEGDLTNAVFDALLEKVTTGAKDIRELSASTEISLTSLGNNIAQQSAALTTTMEQISSRQQTLAASLDGQREVIGGLLNRLTSAQDQTATSADRVASRLEENAQKIVLQVEGIDARAQSALVSVQAATEAFAKEADAIDAQAKQAQQQAQAILASASGLHGQIYDLRTSMQYDGERTAESMNGTLARIATGSSEIREAGTVAEQTLTSLQRVIGLQTGELNASMQQIAERQRELTAALDGQRDVIHGLLNRFALAQDETAVVAERTAARLHEGAQKISDSIDLIGAQANTTLASVQTSVSGFAEQAAALGQQSQQAEQQVRGVLSVTSGMQEQAQRLRESLQGETARVVEQLSSVIGQLDATGRQLKTQGGEAIQTLDQTAQRFATVTETGVDLMRKQSEALAQAIDQSETRLNGAGEKVRGHMRLVSEIGDKTEAQAQQLANAAEFATTRLAALRDTIDVSEKSGRDVVAIASQRIEDVKAALQGQLQHLSAFSQKTVEQVASAAQNLTAQSDALRANLSSSESALTEAAALVREEAKHLPAILDRSASEIENATQGLKRNTVEADKALIGTADRFISVTSAARDNMAEEMQRVSSVADEAGRILGSFNQVLVEQVATMQQSASMLSSEQKDLVEKASLGVGALADASTRLSALRSEASATAERLVREFDTLDQRAASTGGRLSQAGDGIARQVEAITAATARAETQISGTSETLRNQLDLIRSGLQSQIDDISRGLMQITAQLERTGSSLRSTTVGAVSDVERVGQRFEQTSASAIAQVGAATGDVAKLLEGFSGKFDAMIAHMAQAGEDIKHQEGSALGNLQKMLGHLGAVAEKLESARKMSGDVSQSAIERLDEVVTAVQAQMSNMTAGAQTAAGIMRGIGQIYSDQTASLGKGVGEAHNQVLTMNRSIDEMQQRTDRMRTALKLQGDDLMGTLRQILSQLELTGDGLTDAVSRTLHQQVMMGSKKLN
ncbi:MAG: hypothetical protein P4M13_08910 [Alphaproteobacteria bacterium]|nr:hypothetical protein [Alphaproteobacteria bacterium]